MFSVCQSCVWFRFFFALCCFYFVSRVLLLPLSSARWLRLLQLREPSANLRLYCTWWIKGDHSLVRICINTVQLRYQFPRSKLYSRQVAVSEHARWKYRRWRFWSESWRGRKKTYGDVVSCRFGRSCCGRSADAYSSSQCAVHLGHVERERRKKDLVLPCQGWRFISERKLNIERGGDRSTGGVAGWEWPQWMLMLIQRERERGGMHPCSARSWWNNPVYIKCWRATADDVWEIRAHMPQFFNSAGDTAHYQHSEVRAGDLLPFRPLAGVAIRKLSGLQIDFESITLLKQPCFNMSNMLK